MKKKRSLSIKNLKCNANYNFKFTISLKKFIQASLPKVSFDLLKSKKS